MRHRKSDSFDLRALGKAAKSIVNDKVTAVAIGPTTAEALGELSVKVDVTPADYLFDKALDALAAYWSTH